MSKLYDQLVERPSVSSPDWEKYWGFIMTLEHDQIEIIWVLVLEYCKRATIEPKTMLANNKKGPPALAVSKLPDLLRRVIINFLNQVIDQ